jgi:hypothetical protein
LKPCHDSPRQCQRTLSYYYDQLSRLVESG